MAYIEELYLKEKERDKNRLMDLGMFSSFWMVDMNHAHRQICTTEERQALRKL